MTCGLTISLNQPSSVEYFQIEGAVLAFIYTIAETSWSGILETMQTDLTVSL
jgi:hypothetical protein